MDSASNSSAALAFGRFVLLPRRRELLADDQPVRLGGRAFDLLMALVEARGSVISKDALMARVWPNQVVEENALQSQISDLRAALGGDRDLIRTVAGRGYQFTGKIRVTCAGLDERVGPVKPGRVAGLPPTNLPEPVSELIGRDDVLGEIATLAGEHRLVTLTGAGGIGKTRLALAVARQLLPQFADGAWLAELSPLADPGLVFATVAAAAGVEVGSGELSPHRLAQALADRQMLLVLDTCEHVIVAAAALAEEVLRAGRKVCLLATSREPLAVEGEWVYPVPPLAVPGQGVEEHELLSYGAVRLFIERARAANPRFAPERRLVASIAAICQQLDGMPLAIEMGAARTSALPVNEIAARLDDRFRLLTAWRRTSFPRHQTLRATFDWSYELLSEPERVALRRLAIFAGPLSLEAACAVVASPAELAHWGVVEALSGLVAKSLIVADVGDDSMPFRLLDTTRAYALEKLRESGERPTLARRHAEYYRGLFERAEAEVDGRPAAEWLAEYGRAIDNLRAALDWAFSSNGDLSIGIGLTTAAVPLWMHLSLLEECRRRVEQARDALATGAEVDARQDMKLYAALGASLIYTRGGGSEVASAWTKALEIAESLDDTEYQMRSLWGLWSFHVNGVQYRTALTLARRFSSLAATRPDPNDRLVGERMIAIAHHCLGDQPSARRHIERALHDSAAPDNKRQIIRLQLDPRVTARVHLARIFWLQGFPDRAMRVAERSIDDARTAQHAISLSYALARAACPIALWIGDLAAAEHYADTLLDYSKRHALAHWQLYGRGYRGAVATKRGDVATGLRLLGSSIEEVGETRIAAPRFMRFAAIYMAEALGQAGQISEALSAIDDAIGRAERTDELWQFAELMRVKGELLLLQDAPGGPVTAEHCFRQALDCARRQGAVSWELRAATSLARLAGAQGRDADALATLQPVYERFTEGFDTADLRTAKAILDALR
jgi:predicted ATPase/DNA-binding winged helix-turn-helix (wHTH) protein